jgi:hypothetical protein
MKTVAVVGKNGPNSYRPGELRIRSLMRSKAGRGAEAEGEESVTRFDLLAVLLKAAGVCLFLCGLSHLAHSVWRDWVYGASVSLWAPATVVPYVLPAALVFFGIVLALGNRFIARLLGERPYPRN